MLLKKTTFSRSFNMIPGKKQGINLQTLRQSILLFLKPLYRYFPSLQDASEAVKKKKGNWGRKPKCLKGFLKGGRVEFSREWISECNLTSSAWTSQALPWTEALVQRLDQVTRKNQVSFTCKTCQSRMQREKEQKGSWKQVGNKVRL